MRRRNTYLVWDADNREYRLYNRQSELRRIPAGKRNPIARWRIAIATVIQTLTVLIVGLFVLGVAQTPWQPTGNLEALLLVAPLAVSLLILMLSAIFLGMLGTLSGRWRPDETS